MLTFQSTDNKDAKFEYIVNESWDDHRAELMTGYVILTTALGKK